ncbi:MAG: hypothetical protein H6742_11540 [Alphaproteobacteria bacterium]|nr:hypothetical protein [Alphaproteobacteria bacterium]
MPLLALALSISTAHAVDLDLTIGFDDQDPVHLLIEDATAPGLPRLMVEDTDGQTHVVGLAVQPTNEGFFTVDLTVQRLVEDRKGRLRPSLESEPSFLLREGVPATSTIGAMVPYRDGDELKWFKRELKIQLVVLDD